MAAARTGDEIWASDPVPKFFSLMGYLTRLQRKASMQIGVIGLGRMGSNITRRLRRGNHDCVVYDADTAAVNLVTREGTQPASSLKEFVRLLTPPRVAWVMLPAGAATEETIAALAAMMQPGDTIIDGGNTFYHDDVRRAAALKLKGIHYLDIGTSGGIWGLDRGYCLMIGGEREVAARLDPIFSTLAPGRDLDPALSTAERGYQYCGKHGAGHFVKMIHNGIEYGMMQAIAEGFDILHSARKDSVPAERRYEFDLAEVAEVWRHGSVISSWLLDLTAEALAENGQLSNFSGNVQDSGEGRWTVTTAIEESVPAPVLTAALFARFRSRQDHTFADRVLSAMRFKFGGHVEHPPKP